MKLALASLFSGLAYSQSQYYLSPVAETTTREPISHPGGTVEYKQTGICETTAGVKAYSGYVRLPSGLLNGTSGPHDSNIFFWFFESRHNPLNAPLAIHLDGGPGSSALQGALTGGGPCNVNRDSNSTTLNPWSWNNHVNMLYIDQPQSVGYSYNRLVDGTLDVLSGAINVGETTETDLQSNGTTFPGTFSEQDASGTTNSTLNGAHVLWHFMQNWLSTFPEYRSQNDRVSMWGQAFGAQYATLYAKYFEEQNKKIDSGASFENGTRKIQIETIGLVNGWVDMLTQAASYLSFPFNNTYGIQMTSSSVQEEITTSFHRPGGCCDITEKCQSAAETYDPENTAINATVNELCFKSAYYCTKYIRGPLAETQYAPFDIGHYQPDPFPYNYFIGFLNQDWVREGLGVPVNFTSHSNLVFTGYIKTGTFALPWALPALGGLLDSGVKVAMMYGDRDLDVNWIGGEQVSLKVNYSSSNQFSRSGYEDIILDGNHVAGSTRQYGNFSFSRVFEAGNRVPTYQPQAAYEIFMRAMFGKDIATGAIDVDDHYSSVGEPSSWHHRSALPKMPAPECYIWAPKTCTSAQVQALADGTAWVRDYIVLD